MEILFPLFLIQVGFLPLLSAGVELIPPPLASASLSFCFLSFIRHRTNTVVRAMKERMTRKDAGPENVVSMSVESLRLTNVSPA